MCCVHEINLHVVGLYDDLAFKRNLGNIYYYYVFAEPVNHCGLTEGLCVSIPTAAALIAGSVSSHKCSKVMFC